MNIYVGNLNSSAGENELWELFSSFGNIKRLEIIIDKNTNHSMGFAFVEMDYDLEGQQAISHLNKMNFMGQYLEVREVREQAEKGKE